MQKPRTPSSHLRRPIRLFAVCGLLVALTGCTDRSATTDSFPLPVSSPDVIANPPNVPNAIPDDVQELPIAIADGAFQSDVYSAQQGPIVLQVTPHDGPITLSIDGLLQPRTVPHGQTTNVGITAPDPGSYTMRLAGTASDTAILNVRQAGFR